VAGGIQARAHGRRPHQADGSRVIVTTDRPIKPRPDDRPPAQPLDDEASVLTAAGERDHAEQRRDGCRAGQPFAFVVCLQIKTGSSPGVVTAGGGSRRGDGPWHATGSGLRLPRGTMVHAVVAACSGGRGDAKVARERGQACPPPSASPSAILAAAGPAVRTVRARTAFGWTYTRASGAGWPRIGLCAPRIDRPTAVAAGDQRSVIPGQPA